MVSAAGTGPPGQWRYRAVERGTGRVRHGEMSGESPYTVRAALRRAGWEVERLEPIGGARPAPAWWRPLAAWRRARRRHARRPQRADLCDAIAALLEAGLPLEQAVGSLAASRARPAAERRMLRALRDRLRAGSALSEAARAQDDWFDQLDVAMLAAGQTAGELPRILHELGEFHQRGAALGHRLLMALAYPALLCVAAIGAVVFISHSTMPQLLGILADADIPAPWLSAAVVAVGRNLVLWWPLVVGGIVGLVLAVRAVAARIDPDSRLGGVIHGNLVARARTRARVAQLASVLARLLHSGVPLDEALEVAAATVGSPRLRALLTEAGLAVRRGQDLSAAIEPSPLVDAEFAQLLRVGEHAGELASMLDRIAVRYQRAAERAIERLGAVLEPTAIVVMAALIGTVVVAAVLPLVALGDLV